VLPRPQRQASLAELREDVNFEEARQLLRRGQPERLVELQRRLAPLGSRSDGQDAAVGNAFGRLEADRQALLLLGHLPGLAAHHLQGGVGEGDPVRR